TLTLNLYITLTPWKTKPRNLNYWDSAASFAGEVDDPGRRFPLAMLTCVVLVVLCNNLPVLVGTCNTSLWEDGYFEEVAAAIAGRWLGVWVVAAAAVSNIGLFEAEMSSDSFQVMGMAEWGMLPAVFARRGPHGTSALAVAISSTGVLFLGLLEFTAIIEILNLLCESSSSERG
ncbi:unnamed protein product, partial [Discosporangium mesarthrocarpum]